MDQHLYKYLVLYGNLSIPQIGSFSIKNESAHFDPSSGLLYAPASKLSFSEGIVPMSEKIFFNFLANEMGVDELTAIKQFHDFSHRFRNELIEHKSVTLEGLGSLSIGEDEVIVFHPVSQSIEFMPPVNPGNATMISTVIEEETIDTVKSENWWAYAIILFIIGLGALVYYYI